MTKIVLIWSYIVIMALEMPKKSSIILFLGIQLLYLDHKT